MSGDISQFFGGIKSIQRGTTSANVTVTGTDMNKSVLIITGAASSTSNPENASLIQTASTTLTYNKGSLSGSPVVAWQLVEFY